jgi:hypothetical protein
MNGDYDDPCPDNTLGPSESLDSDDFRNDDGDVVVDDPNRWIAVVEHQRLAHTNWHKAITIHASVHCGA